MQERSCSPSEIRMGNESEQGGADIDKTLVARLFHKVAQAQKAQKAICDAKANEFTIQVVCVHSEWELREEHLIHENVLEANLPVGKMSFEHRSGDGMLSVTFPKEIQSLFAVFTQGVAVLVKFSDNSLGELQPDADASRSLLRSQNRINPLCILHCRIYRPQFHPDLAKSARNLLRAVLHNTDEGHPSLKAIGAFSCIRSANVFDVKLYLIEFQLITTTYQKFDYSLAAICA